jgi:hypothetical protein
MTTVPIKSPRDVPAFVTGVDRPIVAIQPGFWRSKRSPGLLAAVVPGARGSP